jgi:hypothetical protein
MAITPEDTAVWMGRPAPAKKTGNAFTDMPKLVAAGAVDLAGAGASLATRGIGALTGSEAVSDYADDINRGRAALSGDIRATTSPLQQEASGQTVGEAWKSGNMIRKVAGAAAESLPSLAVGGLGAKGILAAGEATGLVKGGFEGLSKLSQRGVIAASEAAVTGVTAPEDTRLQVENTPTEQLAQQPGWAEALAESGGDEAKARKKIAGDASVASLSQAAGTALGSMIAGSGVLGMIVGKELRGASRIGNMVQGFRGEMAQEAVQSGLERAASNWVTQKYMDKSTQLLDGVVDDMIIGGLAGGVLGAGGGLLRPNRPEAPAAPPAPTEPPVADASAPTAPPAAPPAAPTAPAAPSSDFPAFKAAYAQSLGLPDTDALTAEANVAYRRAQGDETAQLAPFTPAPVPATEGKGDTRITRAQGSPEVTQASGGLTRHVLELPVGEAERAKAVTLANRLVKSSTVPVEFTNTKGAPLRLGFATLEDAAAFYEQLKNSGVTADGKLTTGSGKATAAQAKQLAMTAAIDPNNPDAGWRLPTSTTAMVNGAPTDTVVISNARYQALRRAVGLSPMEQQESELKWVELESGRKTREVTPERLATNMDMTAPEGKAPSNSVELRKGVTAVLRATPAPTQADVEAYIAANKDLKPKTVEGLKLWGQRLANGGKDESVSRNEETDGQEGSPTPQDGDEAPVQGGGQSTVPAGQGQGTVPAEVKPPEAPKVETPPAAKVESAPAPKVEEKPKTRSEKLKEAGYTRRKTGKTADGQMPDKEEPAPETKAADEYEQKFKALSAAYKEARAQGNRVAQEGIAQQMFALMATHGPSPEYIAAMERVKAARKAHKEASTPAEQRTTLAAYIKALQSYPEAERSTKAAGRTERRIGQLASRLAGMLAEVAATTEAPQTKEQKAKALRAKVKKEGAKTEVKTVTEPKATPKKKETPDSPVAHVRSAVKFLIDPNQSRSAHVSALLYLMEEAEQVSKGKGGEPTEAAVMAQKVLEQHANHPGMAAAKESLARVKRTLERMNAQEKLAAETKAQMTREHNEAVRQANKEAMAERTRANRKVNPELFGIVEDASEDADVRRADAEAARMARLQSAKNSIGSSSAVLGSDPQPVSAPLRKLMENGDIRGALGWIEANSTNNWYRRLAATLGKLLPAKSTMSLILAKPDTLAPMSIAQGQNMGLAQYDTENGGVAVYLRDVPDSGAGVSEEIFLHEMVHAVVFARFAVLDVYMRKAGQAIMGGSKGDRVLKEFETLWREFRAKAAPLLERDDAPVWLREPAKSRDEFLTYALTNPELRVWMLGQQYGAEEVVPVTFWDKFIAWGRSLLGMGPRTAATSWFDKVVGQTSEVLEVLGQETPDYARVKKYVARIEGSPAVALDGASAWAGNLTKVSDKIPAQVKTGSLTLTGWLHRTSLGWSTLKNLAWTFGDQFPQMRAFTEVKNLAAGFANGLKRNADHTRARYDNWARKFGGQASTIAGMTQGEVFLKAMDDITSLHINPRVAFEKQRGYMTTDKNGNNAKLRVQYDEVMKLWQALAPSGGQKILREKLEFTENLAKQEYEAALVNIIDLFGEASQAGITRDSTTAQMEDALMNGRLGKEAQDMFKPLHSAFKAMDGTYFHIGRFGEYYLRYNDENNERVFQRFETEGELAAAVADVKSRKTAAGVPLHEQVNSNKEPTFSQGRLAEALPREFRETFEVIKRLYERIDGRTDLSDAQKAGLKLSMRDMYISMLPEMSPKRVMVKRKEVAGYDRSALPRSWAKRSVISINRLSRLKFTPLLNDAMKAMASQVAELERGTDVRAAVRARDIFEEVKRRDAQEYDTNELPWVSSVNAVSHNFYLGMSPAYLLTNLLQPFQLTLPTLGARHGFVKSMAAMVYAQKKAGSLLMAMAKENSLRPYLELELGGPKANFKDYGLTYGEASALKQAFDTARIDGTYYSHINAVADGQTGRTHRLSMAIGVGAHYGEILNRLVTTLAAYNLELQRQKDPKFARMTDSAQASAETYAMDMVDKTQFDYSVANKGRQLGTHGFLGPVTPLVTQFASYSVQMIEMLARTAKNATVKPVRDPAETDEEYNTRAKEMLRENRRLFAGVMTTTGVLAGSLGLPMATVIARALETMLGDDDEPYDAKVAYQTWLAGTFGEGAGEVLAKGLPRALGVDLSRSGMQDLLPFSAFLADRRRWEDRVAALAVDSAGPAFGLLGMAARTVDAADAGLPGAKVVEIAAPNAIKGLIKAFEAVNDGYPKDSKGNKIPVELNSWDIFQMGAGLTPAVLKSQREKQYAENTREQLMGRRQTQLRTKMRQAIDAKDPDAAREAQAEIDAFNTTNPAFRVTLTSVYQGLTRADRDFAVGLRTGLPGSPRDVATGKQGVYPYR